MPRGFHSKGLKPREDVSNEITDGDFCGIVVVDDESGRLPFGDRAVVRTIPCCPTCALPPSLIRDCQCPFSRMVAADPDLTASIPWRGVRVVNAKD